MQVDEYVFSLGEDARKYCEETLKETENSRRLALRELREWIDSNPELHVRPECQFLLPFLRGCKFNLDRAKTKLRNYYTMRRDCPEWFTNRDPNLPQLCELVNLGVFVPLKKTKDNQLVVIIRTGVHSPKTHKQDDVFKVGNMILDVASREIEETQIFGVLAIFDMNGVTFSHARQLTRRIIKKAVFSWQNYHCRPKQLEFVKAPFHVNVVLRIFKSFMSEKLRGRVNVHFGGDESLQSILPKDILPLEYGGDGESLRDLTKYWQEKLVENSEWFREDEKFKAE